MISVWKDPDTPIALLFYEKKELQSQNSALTSSKCKTLTVIYRGKTRYTELIKVTRPMAISWEHFFRRRMPLLSFHLPNYTNLPHSPLLFWDSALKRKTQKRIQQNKDFISVVLILQSLTTGWGQFGGWWLRYIFLAVVEKVCITMLAMLSGRGVWITR